MLNFDVTRVNRLLKTLSYIGIVEQDKEARYLPGPGIHVLSSMSLYNSGILKNALPDMLKITKKTKLGCALGLCWHQYVCYIFHSQPGESISGAIGGHSIYPISISSIGRVVLAHKPKKEVAALLKKYKDDIPPWPNWQKDCQKIRKLGYYLSSDKDSLTMPIGNKPVVAIAITHISEKRGDIKTLVADLKHTVESIRRKIEHGKEAAC